VDQPIIMQRLTRTYRIDDPPLLDRQVAATLSRMQPTHVPAPAATGAGNFWTRGPGIVLLFAAAGVVIAVIALLSFDLKPAPTASDVKMSVLECRDGFFGAVTDVQVVNEGARTATVVTEVVFRDATGTRVGAEEVWITAGPGETARKESQTNLDADPSGKLTCAATVTKVS
jgi:hypothetical protein